MASTEMGLPWLVYSIAAAFVVLLARLAPAGKSFRLTLPEVIASSIPVGIVVSAWMVFATACLTSAIGNHTVFASVLMWAYLVFEHLEGFSANLGPAIADLVAPHNRLPNLFLAGVMAVAGLVLTPLYNTRMLPEENGRVFSGGSCWADLPMHMTVAESFINGRNQDVSWSQMVSPIFAGDTMAYPFLPDFHAAVMVKMGGVNLRWAFLSTGLPLALAMTALLFTFSLRLTRSALGAALAVLLVYGTGGMGGWNLLRRDGWGGVEGADVVQNDVTGEGKAVWFAFLPHVVLPQRGANFAYPTTLLILTLVWVATEWGVDAARAGGGAGGKPLAPADRTRLLVLAGLLAGLLPLVQAHSFIACACIIGTVFVLDAHKWLASPALAASWAAAGLAAAAVALPQLRLFSGRVAEGAGGKFIQLGWWYIHHDSGRAGGLFGFFSFWWLNTGPSLLAMLAALAALGAECLGALALVRAYGAAGAGAGAGAGDSGGRLEALADSIASYGAELAPAPPADAALAVAAAAAAGLKAGGGFSPLPAAGAGAAGTPSKAGAAAALAAGEEEEEEEEEEGVVGAAAAAAAAAAEPPAGTKVASAYSSAAAVAPAAAAAAAAAAAGSPALAADEPHFLYNLWCTLKSNMRDDTGGWVDLDRALDARRYAWRAADLGAGLWMNRASLTGRSFDALKFALGAFVVFLVGNYVMFQPWDRDNCKMWYVGLFINGAVVGGLLAAPFEAALFAAAPWLPAGQLLGFHRLLALTGSSYGTALFLAQPVGELESALPLGCYARRDLVRLPALEEVVGGADKTPGDKAAAGARARLAGKGSEVKFSALRAPVTLLALVGAAAAAVAFFFLTFSGFLMVRREFGLYHQMLDEDQFSMAAYLKEAVPPKAVILHRDIHISPAGALSGRISLVGYNGWMWSHGYNYHERDRDRTYVLENALKDSDPQAYNLLRRWGVRYVLGEHLALHARPSRQAWEAAAEKAAAGELVPGGENGTLVPAEAPAPYDEDAFLDGQLKRVKQVGRYDLLEVQGYGFPPV